MKVPEAACPLCDSEWGDYWAEVDGQRMFFCCVICWRAFDGMVREVKRRTGWDAVDEVRIVGDHRGRECTAIRGSDTFSFKVKFDSETGETETFLPNASS